MKHVAPPILLGFVVLALGLAGCGPTSPVPYDRNTKYQVDSASSGFTLIVNYSRTRFVPEPEAVEEACKNAFVTVAEHVAAKDGRRIQQIDEQQITTNVATSGNGGPSSCTATGPVAWQPA